MTALGKGQWTAVVLAGSRPGRDPLADHFGKKRKAMVRVADKPMLVHVVDTLKNSAQVHSIVVLSDRIARTQAKLDGARVVKTGQGISASLIGLIESGEADFPILVTTADHVLLTPQMVDAFLAAASGDLSVAMVEKSEYDRHFEGQKRTWIKLADGSWSGANLFALRSARVVPALRLWQRAEQDRKKARALFLHFGPLLALRALTRTIGLRTALQKAGKRLGLEAHLVSMADAEAAIDVDKPADHALAERILAARNPPPSGDT